MQVPFQVDRFHLNNLLSESIIGEWYSGFNLEDQSKVKCLLLNEAVLTPEQVNELQRVNHILAQREFKSILQPQAWGTHDGRHYLVLPDFGTSLGQFENLKALPPGELLAIMRRLLRGLCFAEAKEVNSHQSIRPDNIFISLEDSQVKLGYFGYPTIELAGDIAMTDAGPELLRYFPTEDMRAENPAPYQYDLYALGLIALELASARPWNEILSYDDQHKAESLRKKLSEQEGMPLPLQELLYKLLTCEMGERYTSYQQALDDVLQLVGQDESGLSLQTFILDTLINGRFKLGTEISSARISRIFDAMDTRAEDGTRPCAVKLVDLRAHPNLAGVFHTRFRQLLNMEHEHLLNVYDVGVHFELGFIAMESGLQSLEDLLIKRGTLPLTDAGRLIYQLCKALTALHENDVRFHGAIKPSNVFLTPDLRTVKLGDALTAEFFLSQGNLNFIGAEYYNPEFIKGTEQDVRSDVYDLGTLFFEMLVGHPPFSFKIEQEIIQDHLNSNAATRVEQALFSSGGKDLILRMLEKNPTARYQNLKELMDELGHLLGYDKKEVVHVPNIFFDFAELSMVGKNAREKSEETLAVRLPAINNRARGALGLLVGHGTQVGDASRAATGALKAVREMLFNPGSISPEFAKLQKQDPEAYLERLVMQLNQRVYREAFATGKTQKYGVSGVIGLIQENTLYLYQIGNAAFYMFNKGDVLDYRDDKWTIYEEVELGDSSVALSSEIHERIGFGEMLRTRRLKRRIKDADQLVLLSASLGSSLSVSEIKELVTSSSDPGQAIELVRGDAIRRRLEGTISCVLLSIGNVVAFADETVSHSKKGMLARNFLNQGDTYLSDGRIEEAIEQFNQALEINPNFAIIHHQLGVAYTRKGLPSYAMSCFDRAIELNEKLAASYVEIARLLRQQKRFREVLPLLRRAAASGAKDPELYAMLANELVKMRNYDEAILYATQALNMSPAHPTAFRDRMIAIKRRSALDTKVLRMFGTRPRLADDKRTRIDDRIEVEVEEDEWKN